MKRYLTPCSPGDPDAQEMTWVDIEAEQLHEPDLTLQDFLKAVQNSRPTVNGDDIQQHVKFTNDFGTYFKCCLCIYNPSTYIRIGL